MSYSIDKKLVVGITSSALFDLQTEDEIYRNEGLSAYREFQIKHRCTVLEKGVAFPFIKRFLRINKIYSVENPVEVVLLSKNSPETGVRIFNAIKHYGLDITRAAFLSGREAHEYIPAFNISLFLSTDENDVKQAIESGFAAGRVLNTKITDDENDSELRIAFDFDGVIADDEAEKIYKQDGLEKYTEYEKKHRHEALKPGPLGDFFKKISFFQKLETEKLDADSNYKKILKTAIVTARSAPAHERTIKTLKEWGVTVDEMFLLGGIEKKRFLEIMKPHIYFDDQMLHLDSSLSNIPLVHVPFGISNVK